MVALMAGGGSGGVVSRGKPHRPAPAPSQRGRAPRPQTAMLTAFRAPAKPKPHPKPSKSVFLPSVGKGKGKGKTGGIAIPAGGWTPAPTPTSPGRATIPHPAGGTGGSPYVNPFAGAKISPARIDMGVDYFGTGKIGAIGPGVITASGNAWQGAVGAPNPGTWITEKITSGPLKGKQVYVAEDVQSLVKTGQTVKAGQPIGQFVAGSGGVHNAIETGFAAPGAAGAGGQTMAAYAGQAASGGDPGAVPTAWGIAYAKVLRALKVATVAIPASGTGSAPSFGIGGAPGRVTLPPSLPPIVIPSGVNPPASGGVAMPPARLAAATSPAKAAKRMTSVPKVLQSKPTGPPVASPTGTTGTTTGTTTITSVTSSTAPPTFINSSTGTGGITPLAQPVASGTTGAKSSTSTLLLVAGAGVILVVILMTKKGKK